MVDDAIVMIENITRYVEQGEAPLAAALKGAEQIGFTIMSLTVSLIAVLIPLLFMGDITGRLFREFAVTLSATILISAAISLTLTPMLCAKLLRHTGQRSSRAASTRSRRGCSSDIIDFYARTLDWVLERRRLTLAVAVGTLVVTVLPATSWSRRDSFPCRTRARSRRCRRRGRRVSFAEMAQLQQRLTAVILENPAVESLSSFIGVDGTNTTLNSGPHPDQPEAACGAQIRPPRSSDELQAPRAQAWTASASTCSRCRTSRSRTSSAGPSTSTACRIRTRPSFRGTRRSFVDRLKQLPELEDVASDLQNEGRQVAPRFRPAHRHRVSGITPQNIDDTLYDSFGQRQVSTLFTQLNQYHLILEVEPEFRTSPANLGDIYMNSPAAARYRSAPSPRRHRMARRPC